MRPNFSFQLSFAFFLVTSKASLASSRFKFKSACSKLMNEEATLATTFSPFAVLKPMIAPLWSLSSSRPCFQGFTAPGFGNSKIFVKINHKVVFEILWQWATCMFSGITNDLSLLRNDFDVGTFIKSINHYKRTVCFREGKPELCSAFGRRNFGGYICICQINTVIVRF